MMRHLLVVCFIGTVYGAPIWLGNDFNDCALVTVEPAEHQIPMLDIGGDFRKQNMFRPRSCPLSDKKILVHNVFRIFTGIRKKQGYGIRIDFDPTAEKLVLHQVTRHNMQRSWEVLDDAFLKLAATDKNNLAHLLIVCPRFQVGDYVDCVYTISPTNG